MAEDAGFEHSEGAGGEVPHESVGPHIFAPRITEELTDPAKASFVYPITDIDGAKHTITPDIADEVIHDPESGLNFMHRHGKRIAAVGGFIGASILVAITAARVIDKKRHS